MNQRKTGAPQPGTFNQPRAPQPNNTPPSQRGLVQPKAASQPKARPAAPPAYHPQPVPKVLQTKAATARPPQAGQPGRPPAAPAVYRPQAKLTVQPKAAAAPARAARLQTPGAARPGSTAAMPRTAAAPPPAHPAKKHSLVQPHRARGASRFRGANAIQLHPLSIKVPGFNEWSRDTGEIDIEADIKLFQTKINDKNPKVTSIEVRKKPKEDHEVVVVGTSDGKYIQMDIASHGAKLRYDIKRTYYEIVESTYKPNEDLRLHDVFKAFFNLSHRKAFSAENYNCSRFAADLAGAIGDNGENFM